MYNYCRDTDPAVLIRGAKNAPRPAGDDTYGPPPGADLGKRTDPHLRAGTQSRPCMVARPC